MVQQAPPAVGTVMDGYRFKGGDPANQASWEPVAQQTGPEAAGFESLGGGWYRGPDGGSYQVGRGGAMVRRADGVTGEGSAGQALKLTEDQGKAGGFARLMADAEQSYQEALNQGFNPTGFRAGLANFTDNIPLMSGVGNFIRDDAGDRARQAELQWSDAQLKAMSGAASPEAEVARNNITFFARPGQNYSAIGERLEDARRVAFESSRRRAGPDLAGLEYPDTDPAALPDSFLSGALPVGTNTEAAAGRSPEQLRAAGYERGEDGVWRKNYTADELEGMGYTYDPQGQQWVPPGGDAGAPPAPPAGPQGGSPPQGPQAGAPQSQGYQTALEQERANSDALSKAGVNYGITDALTGEFNDELAYGAGYLAQGLGNIGRRLTGREIEVSAAERGRAASDVMTEERDQFARERPVQNALGNVLGGAAFGPGGTARSMLGRMAQGSGVGATYGFAGAEGSVADRLPEAGVGAAIGAVAVPVVEKAVAPAVNALARPVVQGAQSAGRFLGRQTGNVGNALGVPGSQRLVAANQPNPLASGMDMFARRSPQQPAEMGRNALSMREQEIAPTFADVVNDGGRGTLRALATRQTPARQAAREFADGRAAGLQDRVSLQARRTISDDPRQPREMRDEFTARARERAAPLYEEAYARSGAPRSGITDALMERPSMREAMGRAARIAREEGRDPTTLGFQFDADGNVLHVREPSMQTMDYVKRGLDDVLEGYRDPVTGRLNLDTAGRAAQQTRVAFRTELERLNPAYKDALAAYGDEAQMTDAVDIGERFLSMEADDFATAIARLSPDQQQIARAAARRAVERQAGTQGGAPGVAQRLSNGREQGARTQALTGDAAPVQQAMGAELQALRNAQGISPAQGSPTSMNAQDAMGAAGAARDVATGNVVGLAGRAMNAIRSRGFNNQEAEAIVTAAIDPAQTDQLVSMLAERMTRREARSLARAIRYQLTTSLPTNQ